MKTFSCADVHTVKALWRIGAKAFGRRREGVGA